MKILIFSVAYEPFIGGAEVAVKEITNRLKDIEFHLVTVNLDGQQKREEKIGNVFVYRIGRGHSGRLLFPFLGAWIGLKLHREKKFDAIWSIMANYAGFAALFFKYFRPRVPFFLTLQEGDPIPYIKSQVWFVYPLFMQIFRRANRIQAISKHLANFAASMGARAPITVIPNGVDISTFSRSYPEQVLDNLKATLGKRSEETFLVTTSRLVPKNGVGDVIKALTHLSPNFKFLIIGTGPLEESLRQLAKNLNVADRVIFAGFVEHAELPKYLKISDIFVRPSLSEGMGNSFIEAMAAGLPVVATSIGGIPDFLEESVTGVFCNVLDPSSVATQVLRLKYLPKLRKKIISNAKKMVKERYDWNLVTKEMREKILH